MYYSVIIPFVSKNASDWHPTCKNFAPFSRGAFSTEEDAKMWAETHIKGYEYTIRRYE